jgi:hypothetical protein
MDREPRPKQANKELIQTTVVGIKIKIGRCRRVALVGIDHEEKVKTPNE